MSSVEKTLTSQSMNFEDGAPTVSAAQKFVIPVPEFKDGEELVYPEGSENAGQPVLDWQGNPIGKPGEKGAVFFNYKDRSHQAVKGDGNEVVILNQVSEEQAAKLQKKIGDDPSKLSLNEFKGALKYAHEELGIGDQYNSFKTFIADKMDPLETATTGVQAYGLHRRDDRDLCHVLFVEGKGSFQGPAASPQKFENGAVILRQPDSSRPDGFDYRLVQPEIFAETYTNKDGSPIDLSKLPRHQA